MKKVLFLIHDLGPGGAEKVLVNLVNNMDKTKFDITVMTLFDVGVNRQFLSPDVTYKTCFKKAVPGNSHIMKLWSPEQLHKHLIKESYDIEIAYLEGPSARVISGCRNPDTKLFSWIHCTMKDENTIAVGFRNFAEAKHAYKKFDKLIFVSQSSQAAFQKLIPDITAQVLYNTSDTKSILQQAQKQPDIKFNANECNLIAVGKIQPGKGFDRLARIHLRLKNEGYPIHTYILGKGNPNIQNQIQQFVDENAIHDSFTFLGYQTNPYQYVAASDLFVCSSLSEGFSTAATEALIVGTPVCTVEVSGMKEMLGEDNEYGIVTENSEEALYEGIKQLLDHPELLAHYKQKAAERGKAFSTEKTVQAVENMFV